VNHFIHSALLVCVFSLPIGIYFAWWKESPAGRFYGFFWLVVAFWTLFVSQQFELLSWMPPRVWGFLLHLGCIYVPLVYFHFALHLTGKRKTHERALKVGYGFMATFLLLIVFTDFFTAEIIYRDLYAYPKPSVLYPVYITFFQVFGFGGAYLIFRWAAKFQKDTRERVHFFLLLQILAHIGAMDNYLIMYDIQWFPLYPYGLYFILPFAIFGSRVIQHLKTKAFA
jgi:hypothetical protein